MIVFLGSLHVLIISSPQSVYLLFQVGNHDNKPSTCMCLKNGYGCNHLQNNPLKLLLCPNVRCALHPPVAYYCSYNMVILFAQSFRRPHSYLLPFDWMMQINWGVIPTIVDTTQITVAMFSVSWRCSLHMCLSVLVHPLLDWKKLLRYWEILETVFFGICWCSFVVTAVCLFLTMCFVALWNTWAWVCLHFIWTKEMLIMTGFHNY